MTALLIIALVFTSLVFIWDVLCIVASDSDAIIGQAVIHILPLVLAIATLAIALGYA